MTEVVPPLTSLAEDEAEPKWVRVVERIVSDIERGALRMGARLPSERDLCAQLDVSRVTLRRAFHALQEKGVLRPSRGRGWYVAGRQATDWPGHIESFVGAAQRLGQEVTAELFRTSIDPAGPADAEAFGIRTGEDIMTFQRVRLIDGRPAVLEVLRMVHATMPDGLLDAADDQEFMVLLAEANFPITGSTATITPLVAGRDQSEALGIEPGTSMVQMRVEVTGDGRLILESCLQYPPHYPLRVWF